jgi:hypothetical protein
VTNPLDLNAPPPNHTLSVTVAREEKTSERNVRLIKDAVLFAVAICFVIGLAILCLYTLMSNVATADDKKWAQSFLTAAAGGIVGYLVRK